MYDSEGSIEERLVKSNERREKVDRETAFTKMRTYMEVLQAKDNDEIKQILIKCIGIKDLTQPAIKCLG